MSRASPPPARPLRIFVSYAHADASIYKRTLESMLRFIAGFEPFVMWSDKDILAGTDSDKRIRGELEKMDIFIALVSPHYAASPYCLNVEVAAAKRRRKIVHTVPIIIEYPGKGECEWLMGLEPLPDKKKTWADIRKECGATKEEPECDRAVLPIREGVKKVIAAVLARKGGKP